MKVDLDVPDGCSLHNRLFNYKFGTATTYLKGQSKEVREGVVALALIFGNTGWSDPEEIHQELAQFVAGLIGGHPELDASDEPEGL